jgi:hypothetical protein
MCHQLTNLDEEVSELAYTAVNCVISPSPPSHHHNPQRQGRKLGNYPHAISST